MSEHDMPNWSKAERKSLLAEIAALRTQVAQLSDDLKAMTEERNRLARMLDDRGVCYE